MKEIYAGRYTCGAFARSLIIRLFPPQKHFALTNRCTLNSTRLLCVDRQLLLRPHFVPEGNIVCFLYR